MRPQLPWAQEVLEKLLSQTSEFLRLDIIHVSVGRRDSVGASVWTLPHSVLIKVCCMQQAHITKIVTNSEFPEGKDLGLLI